MTVVAVLHGQNAQAAESAGLLLHVPLQSYGGNCLPVVRGLPILNGSAPIFGNTGLRIGRLVEASLSQLQLGRSRFIRDPLAVGCETEASPAVNFWGHRMLVLDPPLLVGDAWSIAVRWRPPRAMEASQVVLAFAKAVDGKQGLLLLTTDDEIGVWTEGRFSSVRFPWRSLFGDDGFHELVATGANGSTAFYADGAFVGAVAAQPRRLAVGRVGGDADCGRKQFRCPPQGVGELQDFRLFDYDRRPSSS